LQRRFVVVGFFFCDHGFEFEHFILKPRATGAELRLRGLGRPLGAGRVEFELWIAQLGENCVLGHRHARLKRHGTHDTVARGSHP
jgi:hypothetical protein